MSDLVKKEDSINSGANKKGGSLAPKGKGGGVSKNRSRTTAPPEPKELPVVTVDPEDVQEASNRLVLENIANDIATIEEFKGTETYARALGDRAIPNFMRNVGKINDQAYSMALGMIERQYDVSIDEIYGKPETDGD